MMARRDTPRSDRGYTLVELLVVMVIIGIVANIAIPILGHARLRARAAAIVADFNVVRGAAFQHFTSTNRWPADTGPGMEPAELAPILNGSVSWAHGLYDLEWENWANPDGTPTHPGTGVLIGFSVRAPDAALLTAVEQEWGSPLARRADGVTFAIVPITP